MASVERATDRNGLCEDNTRTGSEHNIQHFVVVFTCCDEADNSSDDDYIDSTAAERRGRH